MNPPNDLSAFVKTLHIPDTMTVSKHVFSAPTNKPGQVPLQVSGAHDNRVDMRLILRNNFIRVKINISF